MMLRNPNINADQEDVLYHLCLSNKKHNLPEMFGDVKFVCMGGTAKRMENFAKYIAKELKDQLPPGAEFLDMQECSYRYNMYKVGPVLCISHGIGVSSMMVMLHEVIKLMFHAKVQNPVFIRIGTSGGLGVQPGTVVISNGALNELMDPHHEQVVCGKKIQRPAVFDQSLAETLQKVSKSEDGFSTILAKTMCSSMDFYEGQARLDGAVCEYSEQDKMDYLRRLYDRGVRNIEMEATAFAALTHLTSIRAAIVCVTLVDRLEGDQVHIIPEELKSMELRPQVIVSRFIKDNL